MKRVAMVGFLGALVMASCGGTSSGGSAASVPSSPAAAAKAAPSGAGSTKPAAAAPGAKASAGAKGPIKIGVILPLTGPQSSAGKDNEDGLKLFLSSVHNTIAGRTIEPLFADDQFQADVALTKAKELVDNQHAAALMGFTATPSGYAVAQWVQQTAHVPMLITSNSGGEGMLTDAKFKSPYLTRWTQTATEIVDVAADWALKQGFRKAGIFVSDYAAGVQNADIFSSTFIRGGGSIVQEQYPPLGTTDYGPFLAQLNPATDVLFTFLPGADGLRFADQYDTYAGQHKPQIIDSFGVIVSGPNLAQLKEKAVGIAAVDVFSQASDDPGSQAFVKAWQAANPGRLLSHDAAGGYMSGQVLSAALDKVGGAIENSQPFLQALYGVSIDSAKGPVKLDANHDITQDIKVFRIVKNGSGVGYQLADTYHDVTDTRVRSAAEIAKFPWEKFKGKWVGMSKEQLAASLKSQ
ncbi:MAG TPA: ABC transporter substrate-binding protein [Chloroflexota bacterium]|nr:ABC transporter substrate-binding protein [Chloroflexota bacterium]